MPRTQLLAQWRELNSIFKKQDKHILINYVYNDNTAFFNYCLRMIKEMAKRHYKTNDENMENYFCKHFFNPSNYENAIFMEHNNEYLTICYWNLREKYLRGQKDFTDEIWEKLDEFYKKEKEKYGKEN